ncbi:immunity 17 family protein [Fusobacterium sp.]|uniref:immunity 17 family protein n=1 Tax=Fusobacterium sp. TaxID=68766 RepID=UPI0029012C9B|nr:immunity 17 family protein [Fusobacterium sp.]MDU1909938.1 immunity 17 family protein [Fusobacterium sp.]
MEEAGKNFMKLYGAYLVPLVGFIFLFGAIFNWKWVTDPAGDKLFMRFIYRTFGDKGYRITGGINENNIF